jgi:hypothetical protein
MANEYAIALIGVGGALAGTVLGAGLTNIGQRRAQRYGAMRDLAEVRPLLWASSDLATLRKTLHRVDVSLIEVDAREDLRGALRVMALECWHYDNYYRRLDRGGIRIPLITTFDAVHRRLLQDLRSGYFRKHFGKQKKQTDALVQRVSAILDDMLKDQPGVAKVIKLRVRVALEGVGVKLLDSPKAADKQQVVEDEAISEDDSNDEEQFDDKDERDITP